MDGWMEKETSQELLLSTGTEVTRERGHEGPGVWVRQLGTHLGVKGVHAQLPSAKTSGTKLSPTLGAWKDC